MWHYLTNIQTKQNAVEETATRVCNQHDHNDGFHMYKNIVVGLQHWFALYITFYDN